MINKNPTPNVFIYPYGSIQNKILEAVDMIADPIRQTMSPKGSNVIFEDALGHHHLTNDGVTIAKNISVKDPVHNMVIEAIKEASLQTNSIAGDGTSSTVLQSSILIKEGLKLVESGHNRIDVRDTYNKFADDLIAILAKDVKQVKTEKDLEQVALVSASNDEEIAKNVVDIVKFVGKEGQVMIEPSYTEETSIVKESGFMTSNGIFDHSLLNERGGSMFKDVPVLITDKRLYYQAEAETILKTVMDAGHKEVVIVAADFLNEAISFFIANHKAGSVKIILVREDNVQTLEDIATYLGTEVLSEKSGSIVDNIQIEDFAVAKQVIADPKKIVISRVEEKNKKLDSLVKYLQTKLKTISNKKDPEHAATEKRISLLTRGMATLKVGGRTPVEANEKIYRYEDAINATRVAQEEGYLIGGGVSMFNALAKLQDYGDYNDAFRKVCYSNLQQIVENCGESWKTVLSQMSGSQYKSYGYNALTGKVENMEAAGIIEPFLVTKNVIKNSISAANNIISSGYMIVVDRDVKE